MAINYLNNVDFNRNELQDAQLIRSQVENQPNDAAVGGTPVEGQLYFNTANDVLKVYANGSWVAVGGGVESIDLLNSTYVSLADTGTTAIPELTASLSASDGSSGASERYLTKSNVWAEISTIPGTYTFDVDGDFGTTQTIVSGDTLTIGGDGVKISTTVSSTDILTISHELQSQTNSTSTASPAAGATFTVIDSVTVDTTGHIGGKNLKTITLPAAPTVGDGQINGATSGLGISGSMSATANQSGDTTFTVASNATTAATASTLMYRDSSGYSNVITPASGDSTTKIATTAFVQAAVTGLLEFKGGFNATSGELDDGSGNDLYTDVVIQIGDYYVVTTAGNFFGNAATPLTVGDSVIAQNAVLAPGTTAPVEGDFIVVQSDTDLATSTTVGLGNVNASTEEDMLGINVAYASGTAKVGLDIEGLTEVTTTSNASVIPVFDNDDEANRVISVGNLASKLNVQTSKAYTITDNAVITYPFTLTAGTINDTIIQLIDTVTNDTVYADVNRTSVTTATITFSATPTNSVRVLVQKIG